MGFSRHEYWSGLPPLRGSSRPRELNLRLSHLLHWQAGSLLLAPPWSQSFQSLSRVQLFVIPWTAAHQASLSITNTATWKFPLKDFIQEGVQGISTKHVSKRLVRGDKFTLSGKLGERVAADV